MPNLICNMQGEFKALQRYRERILMEHDARQTEGIKHDDGKPEWDLLPMDAINEVARVLTYGKKKYAARNWEKGMAWGRLIGASMRHIAAFMKGEEKDPESGEHHLAHAACDVLFVLAYYLRNIGKDDRKPLL